KSGDRQTQDDQQMAERPHVSPRNAAVFNPCDPKICMQFADRTGQAATVEAKSEGLCSSCTPLLGAWPAVSNLSRLSARILDFATPDEESRPRTLFSFAWKGSFEPQPEAKPIDDRCWLHAVWVCVPSPQGIGAPHRPAPFTTCAVPADPHYHVRVMF